MLDDLGFLPARNVQGRASIADLFKPQERCGIYILHFANGEFYAGQAIDVTRRYVQHRNIYSDIIKLSFKSVAASHLNDEERNVIWQLEQNGYSLRNITFTSLPKGEADFDLVMPLEEQEQWLQDLNFIDNYGERFIDPDLRRKFHRNYQRFLQTSYAGQVIDVLRTYVCLGIPAVRRGEVSFWCVSCMPKRSVYSRLNIYWQEVLTAFTSEDELWFSLHFAASPFDKLSDEHVESLFQRYPTVEIFDHRYKAGGSDQIKAEVPVQDAKAFITDVDVLPAIRLFNWRLMKKGPCNFGRYHCMDLADRIIEDNSGESR
jgi:hypothetical protein